MSKFNPRLKIDFISIFNRLYSNKPYEVRRAMREIAMQDYFKLSFGALAIDRIIERTLEGKDKNGKAFKPYSKAYKESLSFQLYKSGNNVNLELTGEMLASMESKPNIRGITVEFVDDLNRAKAHGHITGMSGRKGGVVRDFFGLSEEEENTIMKRVMASSTSGELQELRRGSVVLGGRIGEKQVEALLNLSEFL